MREFTESQAANLPAWPQPTLPGGSLKAAGAAPLALPATPPPSQLKPEPGSLTHDDECGGADRLAQRVLGHRLVLAAVRGGDAGDD